MSARTKNKIKRQFQGVEVFLTRHVCKYVFTEVRGKTVCFACGELICVFEEYNLNRHSETKHTEMDFECFSLALGEGCVNPTQ